MKFRKKPIVIEAEQFMDTSDSVSEIMELAGGKTLTWHVHNHTLSIPTLEGNMTASNGDWIIKGVNGELYPCKPDIFRKTYEEASISKTETTSEPCEYCRKPIYLKWNVSFIDGYYKLNDDCNYCPNCGRKLKENER